MSPRRNHLIPVLMLLVLVALGIGVWRYLVSDRMPEPVEPHEPSDLADDPVFSRQPEDLRVVDAGLPESPKNRNEANQGPSTHGFCPADGRMRGVNLKKALRYHLDSARGAPDQLLESVRKVSQAARQGEVQRALRMARQTASEYPEESLVHALVAYVALYTDDQVSARRALSRARRLDSTSPYLALAFGGAHANGPDLDDAIRALDVFNAYLEGRDPRSGQKIVAPYQLRARLDLRRELQNDFYRLEDQGVVLLANPGLAKDDARALLDLVIESLQLASKITRTERRPELTVVVYRDRSELLAVTCSASWAGGVFDGTLRLQTGKRRSLSSWKTIIRHESVHAQLRSVPIRIPTWFDEGLAQLVAGQFGRRHIDTFEHMLDNRTYIPFPHMFGTFSEFDTWDHAKIAYHQSLAMLTMMIAHSGDRAIGDSIAFLESGGLPGDLMEHIMGKQLDGSDILDYLEKCRNNNWIEPKSPNHQ